MIRFLAKFRQAISDPTRELGRWSKVARYQLQLWRFCFRRLRENNLMAMSAALSFRTIFALIPLLIFALLVLKSIGVIEDSKTSLRQFLDVSGFSRIITARDVDTSGLSQTLVESFKDDDTEEKTAKAGKGKGSQPPSGQTAIGDDDSKPKKTVTINPESDEPEEVIPPSEQEVFNVADYIERIVTNVESKLTFARVGPVGGALLIWTALTLLNTIESSLNRVFGAPRSRSVGTRIVLYWSALTLGPVVLVLASYVGGRMIETFREVPVIKWLMVPVGFLGPIFVGILVVSTIYKLLPNTRVKMRSAIGGAFVAVPLWLIARWGFTLYIQHLVIKGSLYGVLGVLPLFLIWVNLSWTIFLFGAQLAHTATNLERLQLAELAERINLGPSDMMATALVVARYFRTGKGPMPFDEICHAINLPGERAENVLDRLTSGGVVCPASMESAVDGDSPSYALAKPAEQIPAADVLALADPRPPEQISSDDTQLRELLATLRSKTQDAQGEASLADLLNGDPRTTDHGAPK